MKTRVQVILVLILTICANSAFAQISDYKINSDYKADYQQLKQELKEAQYIYTLDSLKAEIDSLRMRYIKHESVINHGIYPDKMNNQIAELKALGSLFKDRQLVIESLNDRLNRLNSQLSSYESELKNLNVRTDSLKSSLIHQYERNRDVTATLKDFRSSMELRDHLLINIIDSLFAGYGTMESEKISEFKSEFEVRDINEGEHPLEFLQTIIKQNTQLIKSSKENLETEDLLRMYVIQHRFSEVWNKIGDNLTEIYGGSHSKQWKSSIDQNLIDWKATASRNMWKSLDDDLDERNLNLSAFDNNESFYSAIDMYVKQAIDASREKVITTGEYQDFQAFYDFWNSKLKKEWGEMIQESEVLTTNQISAIDSEMMEWREVSKPQFILIPIMLVVSLLMIVVLIIVLARRPNRNSFNK